MKQFDDFKWLLSQSPILERRLPDNRVLAEMETGDSIGYEEYNFIVNFYNHYLHSFDKDFILGKINKLNNSVAKTWALVAITHTSFAIKRANLEFKQRIEKLVQKSGITYNYVENIFQPYMPLLNKEDYFKFAFKNLDKPYYSYFYLLLLDYMISDYPKFLVSHYLNFGACKKKEKCKLFKECSRKKKCLITNDNIKKSYNETTYINDYQKQLALDFLQFAPEGSKHKAIEKLFESFRQINQTRLFDAKLCLSYEEVLFPEGMPLTGILFLKWDKVDFFDGFYLISHPNKRNSKIYRVDDKNSRLIFNDINKLFLKSLPPLIVEAYKGDIVKVLNKANLNECIILMEHKVAKIDSKKKNTTASTNTERKEMTSYEAKIYCKQFKSRYLDYLCAKQLEDYKVVCCIEHRCNSVGNVSKEYSLIFTVKKTERLLYLAYENTIDSRSTYLFPVPKNKWRQCIDKIYDFFASNEINKREQLASGKIYLNLPGMYEYQRILHNDYLTWVERIKYCGLI